jgi:hypothetical protein
MSHDYSAAPTFLLAEVGATGRWYENHLGFHASFFLTPNLTSLPACSEMTSS